MQAEHQEITDFLRRYPPFNELPEKALIRIAENIEVSYFKAGTKIFIFGQAVHAWHVIRSGAVEVYRRSGELYNRLSAGGYFGQFGLLRENQMRFPVTALEDTLVYLVPAFIFHELFQQYDHFADIVEIEDRTRLRNTIARTEGSHQLMTTRAEMLVNRQPVTISLQATVQDAAMKMSQHGVSSLLIVDHDANDKLSGIVTDRDLRNRVVAKGLPYETPITDVMTSKLILCQHHQLAFEAMMMMLQYNVHHLPVLKQGQPLGVISQSDMIRYESQNSLFIVSRIFQAKDVPELTQLTGEVRTCFTRMVNDDANSKMIGNAMSVIGRAFKQRLLQLAEVKLGPPPVPYCFLALGSMARQEQLIVTDQDNALILDNSFDPELHDDYFKQLASFVSDGLFNCGYGYCKGDIMATNACWRQPLSVWEHNFDEWINRPTPQTLLHSFIFFDLDGVWGQTEWVDHLNRTIAEKSRNNAKFLSCMARNALLRTPPLGFFKGFVMEQSGQHSPSIDMKRRGTAPLADLIRVHALAVGSLAKNSFDRLEDIIAANILPHGRGQDLRDAMEFISMVRIRHQAEDIAAKQYPNNRIEPEKLSDFERKNLKDAFQIIMNAQKFLRFRYPSGGGYSS